MRMEAIKCPACFGAKKVMNIGMSGTRPCYHCSGKGTVEKPKEEPTLKSHEERLEELQNHVSLTETKPLEYTPPSKQGLFKDGKDKKFKK